MKLEAILKQLRGQHTLPVEEQLFSHFPGHESGAKRGHSKLQPGSGLPPCFIGEFPVAGRLWCHCVVDARGAFKGKHMLDDSGKIAIDVTGVELQKQFDALEGVLRADVNIGAGVSWDGKPYINFDAMPKSALMKGVGLATAIHQGRSIDLRPTRPLNETLSLEAPFSLYRDGSELNVQVHGVIGAVSLPNSDFYIARR